MKNLRAVVLVVLVLALLIVGMTQVFAQFKFSYTSGFQVQNLSGTDANVSITYYNQDGSTAHTATDTITANGSTTYFPLPTQVSTGFNGSVVVSSDQAVGAVVNVLSTDFLHGASYVGSSAGSTSLLLPLLFQNNAGFDTWFNVQNTGTTTATVNVTYSDGTQVRNVQIPAGASHTFNQATETHSQAVFSAQITSDQPVAAAVIQESSSVVFAYSGFTGGSTNPVMPLINQNNAGYVTGVQIQNAGTQTTTVTVSYTPSAAGSACTETHDIGPGKSETFTLFAFASNNSGVNTTCNAGERFVGSAQVTANSANQPLAAIVNQLSAANGEAYNAFDPTTATGNLVMPLIMDRNGGFFTGFNLINVGTTDTVNCTFTNSAFQITKVITAGTGITELQNGQIADSYAGSATCTASGGGKLLAVVNELGSTADQFLVYEGINP